MSPGMLPHHKYYLLFLCFLFISCGLDDIFYLYPPTNSKDGRDVADPVERYFSFKTTDQENIQNTLSNSFKGFEIFYRIYEDIAVCERERVEISDYNNKNPSDSLSYLLKTKKYATLQTTGSDKGFIQGVTVTPPFNRYVYLRLTPFGSFNACLDLFHTYTVFPPTTPADEHLGIPIRSGSDSKEIPVERKEFFLKNIKRDDSDVLASTRNDKPDENNITAWYVNMYTVTYGFDTSFRNIYSELLPLGYVRIE
ncbi:hypothetical protein [Treponema phagedenis]|uniref:hypothetical protein n=1 Tax=Treponema phagedenis TaxID=162 RepID=UPI0001F63FE9|nr:hypothetical protein [Treponema phagedenis]EFW37106.1 hypothetical protein HMPREF9554_02414 [Treponema phagedenis F0421]TYT79610.1 hypothetical protein FS559_11295 [Treponema phagedenis]